MNQNECAIVRDLLPLYSEGMLSDNSREFVDGHLKKCSGCAAEAAAETHETPEPLPNTLPLKALHRSWRIKRLLLVILGLLFAALAFLCICSALKSPQFFPYSQDLLEIEVVGDDLVLSFAPGVTDFDIYESPDPERQTTTYSIEAWTSRLKARNSPSGRWQTTLEGAKDAVLFYVQNNGSEDVCVYGAEKISGGRLTLPALRLGYYLIISALLFASLCAARIIFRHKRIKGALEIVALYPLAYLISPLLLGIGTVSYSFMRDFTLSLSVSGLVFLFLLFLRELWKCRK